MAIIDRISRTFGLSDQDEEKEAKMNTNDELQTPQPEQNEPPIQPPPVPPTGNNIVDFNSAFAARENSMTNNSNNNIQTLVRRKITTVKPKSFDEDAKVIADCLRDDMPVIVNFEATPPDHARRILDFASGITYAINGRVQQISEYVFICTPKTVSVVVEKEERRQEKDISWLTGKF